MAGDSAADSSAARACLLQQARSAIDAGIDMLQIRERDLEAADLKRLVSEIVAMAKGSRCRVIVNDRVDVAIAAGADGVHLRGDSIPPREARQIVPRGFLIGRSVHAVAEASSVAADVDYLIAGAVWQTPSKDRDHVLLGISGFATIAAAVGVPVLAIGGVTIDRVAEVRDAGGQGVAAIGLFMNATARRCRAIPLHDRAEAIRLRFDTSKAPS